MHGKILLSTAYLPPISYFSLIASSASFSIEMHENYVKQSYRNRCYILSPLGRQLLVVPVLEASRHKVRINEVKIDYSKRWQQVHLRAMISAYKNSPYFDFYFDAIEKAILERFEKIWDLNESLLNVIFTVLKLNNKTEYTTSFESRLNSERDFRYSIVPDKAPAVAVQKYTQVFTNNGFVPDLSIIDLLFNMGPDTIQYLTK